MLVYYNEFPEVCKVFFYSVSEFSCGVGISGDSGVGSGVGVTVVSSGAGVSGVVEVSGSGAAGAAGLMVV